MNERVVAMLKALMRAYPPDMTKTDDSIIGTNSLGNPLPDTCSWRRECYSGTQLQNMLNDQTLVNAICRANEGVPMWTSSVFNYLLGYLSGADAR